MNKLYIIGIMSIIIIGVIFSLYKLFKIADKFFREADKVEKMIRDGQSQEEVIKALFTLRDKSFHRQTGSRINELAKMAEIKYNIVLLKK